MAPTPEIQTASCDIKKKYSDILIANGILDEVESVTIREPEELKGEHMAAVTSYVQVLFKDPSKKPKNLFVKSYAEGSMKESMKAVQIMEKESTFFNDFLPEAREYCKKFPGCENLLNFFPKCLFGDDEIVVLENAVLDDTFIMLPKLEFQDLFTAKFVLNNLGKFHGTSAAMIQDVGLNSFRDKYELLIRECFLSDRNPWSKDIFDSGIATCLNFLNTNEVEGGAEAIEKLTSIVGKAYGMVKESLRLNSENKLHVVNHGDCWNNNMLFKKDSETGKVNDHMFVDFQIIRMGSPNLDIGYFLFTSVKPLIRRNHLEELLQHYFESFKRTMESFEKECPCTFEEFFEDYKRKCNLGFFFNLTMLTATGAMKEMDFNDMTCTHAEMMEKFNQITKNWIKNNPEWSARISAEIVASLNEFVKLASL